MSTDLTSVNLAGPMLPAASSQPMTLQPTGATAPATKAGSQPAVANVELHAPRRADLGFDPNEMRKNLADAIDRLNEQMRRTGRELNFSVDDRIQRTVITVRHSLSGEVVRQIPVEEVLRVAHSIEDMKGLIFNEVT